MEMCTRVEACTEVYFISVKIETYNKSVLLGMLLRL